jgi:hypothetical protein
MWIWLIVNWWILLLKKMSVWIKWADEGTPKARPLAYKIRPNGMPGNRYTKREMLALVEYGIITDYRVKAWLAKDGAVNVDEPTAVLDSARTDKSSSARTDKHSYAQTEKVAYVSDACRRKNRPDEDAGQGADWVNPRAPELFRYLNSLVAKPERSVYN